MKPILFSTPMVQAIIKGSKTMTRRVVKSPMQEWIENPISEWGKGIISQCHLGQVGDVLWVREKWRPLINCETGEKAAPDYYADLPEYWRKSHPYKWKPSIYMPKEACRLFLEITSIRVEHLQDITDIDATAEGVEKGYCQDQLYNRELVTHMDYLKNEHKWIHANLSFATLWQKINGKESWNANPWVWVIEFKRIEKPQNF